MKRLRSKLTYSNVVSTLCLFLLIGGGTAFAASQLKKESVGPNQLKKGAVTPIKLSNASKSTLTGPAGPVGPAGPMGATGPQGARGDAGAPGATDVVVREEAVPVVGKETFYVNYAFCKPGEVATGGGAGFAANSGKEVIEQSFPMAGTKAEPRSVVAGEAPTGWGVYLRNNSTTPREGRWFVVCASP